MGDVAWLGPPFSSFLCVRRWDVGQLMPRTNITPALLPPSIYLHGIGLGRFTAWVFLVLCPCYQPGWGVGHGMAPTEDKMMIMFMSYARCLKIHPQLVLSLFYSIIQHCLLIFPQMKHPTTVQYSPTVICHSWIESPLTLSSLFPPLSGWPYCPASSGSLGGWDFLPSSFLGNRGCPSGDSDKGLMNLHFSLLSRRPNKKFPGQNKHKQKEYPYKCPIYTNTVLY